jgi:phenylpropionate dioxygenase-like ring-hydroxylating dioxygenase large terminal subunit
MEAITTLSPAHWSEARRRRRLDMLRRLVRHLADGTTDFSDGPMPLDATAFTDPGRFERECRELFLKRPVLAALSQDIPNPGDSMLFEELGPSIVLVRDEDGKIGAFLNMCAHRGAKVVTECSPKRRMVCRFHGWTYDLKGRLAGIPGAEGFAGIDRAQRGLVRVPVGEWNGMIFVQGEPGDGEIDVERHLGDFAPVVSELELQRARPIKSGVIEAEANWKYVNDTFCEGYHFATLHAKSIARIAVSNVMAYTGYGPNHWMATCRADFRDLVGKPESEWPEFDYGGLYFFFPNATLNVSPVPGGGEFYGLSRVFPAGRVGASRTLMTTYRPGHSNPQADDSLWAGMQDFVENVVRTEDCSVSRDGQRNLEHAPKGFQALIGANEIALQGVHRNIQRVLDGGSFSGR